MSVQLQRYEGAALEPLLERIHRELGPKVRIVKAERVRQGGILGFFTRESFRLTVEMRAREMAARGEASHRLSDILRKSAPSPIAGGPDGVSRGAAARAGDVGEGESDGRPTAADPSSALAETIAIDDRLEITAPLPSTEQAGFSEVLSRVARDILEDPPVGAALGSGGGAAAADGRAGEAGAAAADGEPAGEVLFGSSELSNATIAATETGIATGTALGTSLSGDGIVVRGLPLESAISASKVASALVKAGVPKSLLADVPELLSEDLSDAGEVAKLLVDAFKSLPAPPSPPSLPGSMLAAIGEMTRSRKLAEEIATELGADPSAIPVVFQRGQIGAYPENLIARSALEAAERVSSWKRSGTSIAAAIGAPLAGGNRSWARAVLRSMQPASLWGITDATIKPEDVADWSDCLGGLDALVLIGVRLTVSPLAVISTEIPVARLDDDRATPERWAAVVCDLLERTGVLQRAGTAAVAAEV